MASPRHLVVFDDGCGFCGRSIRLLRRLDWCSRFECLGQSLAKARGIAWEHGVSVSALQEALHVFTVRGQTLRAAEAVRFIALRLPLAAPAGLLLFLPGALPWAQLLYRAVSRHRHRLPGEGRVLGCDSGSCGPAGITSEPREPCRDSGDRGGRS